MSSKPNDRLMKNGKAGDEPMIVASASIRIPDKEVHIKRADEGPPPTGTCSCHPVCTCVPVSSCSCDMVCTCDTVCTCQNHTICTCDTVCTCQNHTICTCQSHTICTCNLMVYRYPIT
jgi:hypothetical protein